MTRKEKRLLMDAAIKETAVPFLRAQGFKGSFPRFRRLKEHWINLLTYQFSFDSSKFVVEIYNCSPTRILPSWRNIISPSKCTAHHMHLRFSVGSATNKGDSWFDFSSESLVFNIYKRKAHELTALWNEAEIGGRTTRNNSDMPWFLNRSVRSQ